ncbi:MAG: alpha/beta hydrolase [Eubacteriales bacterium]|nr:alpha/beta hydrolase [Eubacteriales bacterium]
MGKKKMIAIVVVLLIVLILGLNHKSVYYVFKNVTADKVDVGDLTWDSGKTYLKVPYSEVSESDYLDLYVPQDVESPKLFVLIHGGGFIAGDSDTKQVQFMYRYFRDHGYACAAINYRLAQEAAFPAGLEDCKAAIRFLKANADQYGYDAEHISVFGESAGGYLSLMCSVTGDDEFNSVPFIGQTEENNPSGNVDVLVDYYGYTDIDSLDGDLKEMGVPRLVFTLANNWMIGKLDGHEDYASYWFRKDISRMNEEEFNTVDPFYYIEKNKEVVSNLAVWMIHGDCDITIPCQSSERLYQAFEGQNGAQNTALRMEPGMGHASDPLYSDEILGEIDQFIQEH